MIHVQVVIDDMVAVHAACQANTTVQALVDEIKKFVHDNLFLSGWLLKRYVPEYSYDYRIGQTTLAPNRLPRPIEVQVSGEIGRFSFAENVIYVFVRNMLERANLTGRI